MSEINVDARLIGIIGKPHGIKGETVVMLLTDYPKSIKRGDILFFDEKCTRKAEVENIRWRKDKPEASIIKFKGINSRNDACDLKGINVFRLIKDGPVPEDNQYWVDDILECMVYTKDGVLIGKVINVEKFTSNDNLVVRVDNKISNINIDGDILYVPVIENYIDSIDLKNKKIILKKVPEYI
ncbi:MAG TPA: ribosome maturation factor RimM [Candidatus Humimicrobiaceae bacterium]|nr:ribosome maturation factor RimM [Candidatus Humimicrobiaceae bacterium]